MLTISILIHMGNNKISVGIDSSPSDFAIAALDNKHVLLGHHHAVRSPDMDYKGFIHQTLKSLRMIIRTSGQNVGYSNVTVTLEKAIDPAKRPNESQKHGSLWNYNQLLLSGLKKMLKGSGVTIISKEPNVLRDKAGLKWRPLADQQEYIKKYDRKLIKHICYDLLRQDYELPMLEHRSFQDIESGYVHVEQSTDKGWYDIADAIIAAKAGNRFNEIKALLKRVLT